MIDTQKNAKSFAGDQLNCTNCHFAGGNTTGGAQGGISLVGVATKYPSFSHTAHKVIDLPERINRCFENSMHGRPLPLDSERMLALVTYFSLFQGTTHLRTNPLAWFKKPFHKTYRGFRSRKTPL